MTMLAIVLLQWISWSVYCAPLSRTFDNSNEQNDGLLQYAVQRLQAVNESLSELLNSLVDNCNNTCRPRSTEYLGELFNNITGRSGCLTLLKGPTYILDTNTDCLEHPPVIHENCRSQCNTTRKIEDLGKLYWPRYIVTASCSCTASMASEYFPENTPKVFRVLKRDTDCDTNGFESWVHQETKSVTIGCDCQP